MPLSKRSLADNPTLREALSALDAKCWQKTLEEAGLTPAAAVTNDTRDQVHRLLRQLHADLETLLDPIRQNLQALLCGLEGKSFGSLDANQAVTREIQDLLTRLGVRVMCPKEGCGLPTSLRCAAAGNSKHGVFQFDHASGGRRTTHLGLSTLPKLTLVPAPADKRRASC